LLAQQAAQRRQLAVRPQEWPNFVRKLQHRNTR
jgi:hypothetical protein